MAVALCTIPSCRNYQRYCRLHLSVKEPKENEIKSESDKRKKENAQYQKKRTKYLKDHPRCEFKGCKEKSRDIHHKAGRVGEKLLDVKYFMACCREHHTQIELNPAWARQNGYSVSRLSQTK